MYEWFLSAVKFIAAFACGLCLAGGITLLALTVVATKLWVGAAVFFVIYVIAANLEERTNRGGE